MPLFFRVTTMLTCVSAKIRQCLYSLPIWQGELILWWNPGWVWTCWQHTWLVLLPAMWLPLMWLCVWPAPQLTLPRQGPGCGILLWIISKKHSILKKAQRRRSLSGNNQFLLTSLKFFLLHLMGKDFMAHWHTLSPKQSIKQTNKQTAKLLLATEVVLG